MFCIEPIFEMPPVHVAPLVSVIRAGKPPSFH